MRCAGRRWLLGALGGAIALLLPLVAAAGAAAQGGLLLSPTRIDAEVRAGDALPPISLRNRSDRAVEVDVAAAAARQDLSGLPVFDLSARSLREGRRMLRVSPRQLRLGPGETARVGVIVGPAPRGRVGVYAVIVFSAEQQGGPREGAVVAPAVRLTSNLLLRYPGRARISGRVRSLRAEQGPNGTLRFFARIRNEGNLHTRPRSLLTVTDSRGATVLRRRFRGENVLPGAERELVLDVADELGAGDYTARVDARVGSATSRARARFQLVGVNELPTPALRIVSLPVPEPDAGERFDASVEVENSGTAPIAPAGTIAVTRHGSGRPLATRPVRLEELAPGGRGKAEVELPGVPKGGYQLTVRFTSGGRTLAERSLAFETGTRLPLLTRVQDWLAAHIPLVVAAFVLLLALVVGALVAYIRRLRRAIEARAERGLADQQAARPESSEPDAKTARR